ncbi:MAG TPA: hypothetical protein DDY43_12230 [Synechococcales bacterium UBA10510]|nr:hypothetical protein [Synechococcales bacterium UBA10510]
MATTTRANTNTHGRGGATRSSDEVAVMALERRGCVIHPSQSVNQFAGRNAIDSENNALLSKRRAIGITCGGNFGITGAV